MRAPAAVLIAVSFPLMITPAVGADSLAKAYFAATPPGAWAKYESSWEMPNGMAGTSIYTYIRASDDADRVRIELGTEALAGPGEGMTTRQLFIMEPGFDLARNFMNHNMYLEASVAQTGDGPPAAMQDNVIEIIRSSVGDLTNSVTFKGRTESGGRECDHYSFTYRSGGPHVTTHEGEICLDETLPFGVVFQNGRSTDEAGELVSSYEQKLVDSGTGESASDALLAMTPMTAPPAPDGAAHGAAPAVPLIEAYQSGKVRLVVEVLEGTGGRRLEITAQNQAAEPFDLVVPEGVLTIPAGSPIGDLNLHIDEEHRFSLPPGDSSPPFSAGQPGERGATGGRFQLTVYEGSPLFQGSVEVGPLE